MLTVTPQQRTYLDALKAAGVKPSTDLLALSIGSYVCQARAAKQSEAAVRDYVTPLVRGDVRSTQLERRCAAVRGGRADRRLHSDRYRTSLLAEGNMATKSRRKRHRILALIAAGAMALVVALVVAVVWIMIRQPDKTDTAVPPSAVPPSVPTDSGHEAAPGVPGRQLPRRAADLDPRHLGVVAATRPVQPDAVPDRVAAQRHQPDPRAVRHRPAGGVHRSLHRAVPQSALGRQADVLQRQPRRGHPATR